MSDSPYLFPAANHPLSEAAPGLKLREGLSPFGIAVRYQERDPGPEAAEWCETGHSVFIVAGRLRYRFDDHSVEAGPGDMLHIPAGPAHRHRPQAIGPDPVKYFLTEFV
jgi:quercetin dioxygenase-like cupin family protein